ncbi:MAG: phosphatase PAP2 family protein [Patescibacteria group bacterium]
MNSSLFQLLHSLARQSSVLDAVFVFFAVYALFILWGVVSATFFLAFHNRFRHRLHCHLQIVVLAALSSLLARVIIAEALKRLLHNPRPFEILADVNPLIARAANGSFPSGHTVLAFSAASAIALCYPRAGWTLYAAAGAIGISRVIAGVHWPIDILGGAVIGIGSTYFLHYAFHHFSIGGKKLSHALLALAHKFQTR